MLQADRPWRATWRRRVLAETIGGARVKFRYQYAVVGFAASMTAAQADQLRNHPLVARVEPDMEGALDGAGSTAPNDPNSPDPWGLRRITQADGLAPTYEPCGADGSGVTMVIVDSGIVPEHQEFAGRIRYVGNFYAGGRDHRRGAGRGHRVAGDRRAEREDLERHGGGGAELGCHAGQRAAAGGGEHVTRRPARGNAELGAGSGDQHARPRRHPGDRLCGQRRLPGHVELPVGVGVRAVRGCHGHR
ncbi:MAG: hypothetical protein EBU31_03310 [Proteobacteria bacterium]|nr:hypothetical protein [Pseudomonadota bacterium]